MQPNKQKEKTSSQDSVLVWIGRALVISLLAYSPWNYGMVTWGQHLVMAYWVMLIILLAFLTILRNPKLIFPSGLLVTAPIFLLALVLLQTVSLPSFLYEGIAPGASFEAEILKKAKAHSTASESELSTIVQEQRTFPSAISIYPAITRSSSVGLACAIGLMLAGSILFQDKRSRIVLLVSLVIFSTLIAILGIFQSVSWRSWTLLEMPHSAFFATFVNRNSAPQFFAVGIGSIIALMAIRIRVKEKARNKAYQRRYVATSTLGRIRQLCEDLLIELDSVMLMLLFALVSLIVAVVAAGSRGGAIALVFGLAVTVLFFMVSDRKMIASSLAGLIVVVGIVASALNLFRLDAPILSRLENLNSTDRVTLWTSALSQSEYWFTGSGLGTFQFAIMPANPMRSAWPRHAESIYVEVFSDLGILGIGLVLAWLGTLIGKLLPTASSQKLNLWPVTTYIVVSLGLHSAVDFGVVIPAIFMPLAVIIGAFLIELRKSQRIHQPPKSPETKGTRIVPGALLLSFFTIVVGLRSVNGFAQAEVLAKKLESSKDYLAKPEEKRPPVAPNLDLDFADLDLTHPEVLLQLSKIRIYQFEQQIANLPDWPENLTEKQRQQCSSPEFIAAVLRSSRTEVPWTLWRDFFERHPFIREQLGTYHQTLRYALRGNVQDWRTNWALFQTLTEQNPKANPILWARVDTLCRSVFDAQEVAGTCNLIAGDESAGVQAWRDAVEHKPDTAGGLSGLVGTLVSEEQVLQILPNHPIAVAQLSKALFPTRPETTLELLRKIEIPSLVSYCRSASDWELVAWVGKTTQDDELYLSALKRIANIQVFDVSIRIRIAEHYEKLGEIDQAIQILEEAERRNTMSLEVQQYLVRLRKMSDNRMSPPG